MFLKEMVMSDWRSIADIRRQYGALNLNEALMEENPFTQFKHWFEEVLNSEKSDPTAMVLSTVDEQGWPDSRVVLLKGIEDNSFIFYTNYESNKARQLEKNPYAALNFYWPQMARQVRVRGAIHPTSEVQSDKYFQQRPMESQIAAIASPQSREIANRQALEDIYNQLLAYYTEHPICRPDNWGGYQVFPEQIEFWQGRDNRLHDRVQYLKQDQQWVVRRLAP